MFTFITGGCMKRILSLHVVLFVLTFTKVFAAGTLYVRPLNSNQTYSQMSIKTYDANTLIENQIATTTVEQVFHNSMNANVESTFIFPLPEGAVITDLVYWFNNKKYVASVRVKEEAQRDYDQKISKYIDPALLQYFGDNVFKLNIAPISPNSDVRFSITYTEFLPYEYGMVNYKFLLKTTGLSPMPLERVSLKIFAKTSSPIKKLVSPSHGNSAENQITKLSDQDYSIVYGDENFTPDRDYQLQFEYKRDGVEMNVVSYMPKVSDSIGTDGFFSTFIIPPDSLTNSTGESRTIVFTADISSSMEGERIVRLKDAIYEFLKRLNNNDRFNVILFSTNVISFKPDIVVATEENLNLAKEFVFKVGAAGLTNINDALESTLHMGFNQGENNSVIFITDGMPSWGELETQKIIKKSKDLNNEKARIYVYGIGEEPSKTFLSELAKENGGYAMFISDNDSIPLIVQNHLERISRPVLSDLSIDYGGLAVYDAFPQKLPDLFYGNQVNQTGRFTKAGRYTVTLKGKIRGENFTLSKEVDFESEFGNKSVSRLWAKRKIDFLLDEIAKYGEKKELKDAIIDLSIRFNILTKYTALYADPDVTSIDENNAIAYKGKIGTIMPNPSDGIANIGFTVVQDNSLVKIEVFDVFGNKLTEVCNAMYNLGNYTVQWDGLDTTRLSVPNGTYMVRISVNNYVVETLSCIIQR